jgi:hypothetical protein
MRKRKRGRPRTTGKGFPVQSRLHKPLLTELRKYAREHDLSLPQALAELSRLALEAINQSKEPPKE